MSDAGLIEKLVNALRCLPGVGPKSAQRMTYYLLERDREGGRQLALALNQAINQVGHCKLCRTFSETEFCKICSNVKRNNKSLCVVEMPTDVKSIEDSTNFDGIYFVLLGHLSPLDGIGPEEIGLGKLQARIEEGEIEEVIIATNPTVEGEATAHFISEFVRSSGAKATRIAYGVPFGGELEFVDRGTLGHAFSGRKEI